MQKTYFLKGLDCPHCSAQIESEASKLDCVTSSAVNLVNQTLTIETEKFTGSMSKSICSLDSSAKRPMNLNISQPI